ncbi:hypothetical protein THASP1DRAFT_28545 [Thamnocephalis sphaerospora]|uniref:Uncharacterized protein n=1 Tax=Thamnocephalis sphaerospora TaxID=78915 RepID=A0A4P9XVM0_9FUNG|nr:hypothetical protein THASP1DRAFT_28545 [Thamnocephalis sphaerospora]|eukprot:RKP09661.1 hypothetical protein THASP1DRAFT_28545 [Thamnocephalis sphaerospora]
MRLVFLPRAAAAATVVLTSFVTFGSLASAWFIPPPANDPSALFGVRRPNRPLLPAASATLLDLEALDDYSLGQFRLSPSFAIIQPDGTWPIYHKGYDGHISHVEFITGAGEMARKVAVLRHVDLNKIESFDITDYTRGEKVTSTSSVCPFYDDSNGAVVYYALRTAKGRANARVRESNESYEMEVTMASMRDAFVLSDIVPWDGVDIPIVPSSESANA